MWCKLTWALHNLFMIKEFSLKRDGNLKLSEHFLVREFACKDGSDKILIDTNLIPILESSSAISRTG